MDLFLYGTHDVLNNTYVGKKKQNVSYCGSNLVFALYTYFFTLSPPPPLPPPPCNL